MLCSIHTKKLTVQPISRNLKDELNDQSARSPSLWMADSHEVPFEEVSRSASWIRIAHSDCGFWLEALSFRANYLDGTNFQQRLQHVRSAAMLNDQSLDYPVDVYTGNSHFFTGWFHA